MHVVDIFGRIAAINRSSDQNVYSKHDFGIGAIDRRLNELKAARDKKVDEHIKAQSSSSV